MFGLELATLALNFGLSRCAPSPGAVPKMELVYAGAASSSRPGRALVILESDGGTARGAWPWKYFVSVALVPERGAVLLNSDPTIRQLDDVRAYVSEPSTDSSYALFSFGNVMRGQNFRVVLTETDSSVPPGCKPITFRTVIGNFTEE